MTGMGADGSPRPGYTVLPAEAEALEFLGHEDGAVQVRVGEADDEDLVGIEDGVAIHVVDGLHEVVVIADPQSVNGGFSFLDVRTEGDTFNLGGNFVERDARAVEEGDEVKEQGFGDGVGG